jgi:hypothetical protein
LKKKTAKEEFLLRMFIFYKDKINYETDLKKIYQDNLDIIIKQTDIIVGTTKVIIDKSEKQQNYETELVECRKKVAEYEEKLNKGMFYNFLSSKK